jgi:hypothetical protein
MSLSWPECLSLFEAAHIEINDYIGSKEEIAAARKRDEIIMDLLIMGTEAVLAGGKSDIICVAASNILLRNGVKPLERAKKV